MLIHGSQHEAASTNPVEQAAEAECGVDADNGEPEEHPDPTVCDR